MMNLANLRHSSLALSLIIFSLLIFGNALAAGPLLIAYGGHNETMVPLWVGIEKGLFRKHGFDPQGAADPQRTDHDGDTRVRRGALWFGRRPAALSAPR